MKQVYFGTQMGTNGGEFSKWGVEELTHLGNPLVIIHVSADSHFALSGNSIMKDFALSGNLIMKDHLKVRKGLPSVKKIMPKSVSVRKVIKRVVRTNPEHACRGLLLFARYCGYQLPPSIDVLAVDRGRIILERRFTHLLGYLNYIHNSMNLASLKLDSRLKLNCNENQTSLRDDEELPVIENTDSQTCESVSRVGNLSSFNLGYLEDAHLSSVSIIRRELPELTLGWPLLRKNTPVNPDDLRYLEARDTSVVQWAMNLPCRSTPAILRNSIDLDKNDDEVSLDRETSCSLNKEESSSQAIQASTEKSVDRSADMEDENFCLIHEYKAEASSKSTTVPLKEMPLLEYGWPLLGVTASATRDSVRDSRSTSVLVLSKKESSAETEIQDSESNETCLEAARKLPKGLELLSTRNSYGFRWFSYDELKSATSQFSSECLVGEGGCSTVYKGRLPSGKPVAVKLLKAYKEAWNDFSLEISIIASLKHRYIAPLIGICVEDNYLITVYDFFPKGSLEERLHGHKKKSVLPWEVRFNIAVSVAEALNYLHDESPRPVIHRDVKSSNILLSSKSEPQLSDFGLATWGPTESTYTIDSDVVGTFGYIAPEYFMQGRVSEKIDVYSFGVVLLELLSGWKPVGSKDLNGQEESLVKWAKPLLEHGDLESLLDPKLDGNFDVAQMHSMVLAATLCIKQSAQLRPKASEIMKVLRGDADVNKWVKPHISLLKESDNEDDDDIFPQYDRIQHLSLALDTDDETTSMSSINTTSLTDVEPKYHFKFKDYLSQPED